VTVATLVVPRQDCVRLAGGGEREVSVLSDEQVDALVVLSWTHPATARCTYLGGKSRAGWLLRSTRALHQPASRLRWSRDYAHSHGSLESPNFAWIHEARLGMELGRYFDCVELLEDWTDPTQEKPGLYTFRFFRRNEPHCTKHPDVD